LQFGFVLQLKFFGHLGICKYRTRMFLCLSSNILLAIQARLMVFKN